MSTSLWLEVADRVFQRRYQPFDVSVCAIVGTDGIAVVDTRCGPAEARELRDHLRGLSAAPVRWVVNTHVHFDHVGGNAEFVAPRQLPPAQLWGHRAMATALRAGRDDPEGHLAPPLSPVVPDHLVDRIDVLDLGDRLVRLVHPGPGHTDGDLLVHIPDADAVLAGDLVEESGPPSLGPDSFPLDWPDTLERMLDGNGVGAGTVVVPGHGAPVDAGFVGRQRDDLAGVARRIRALHAAGASAGEALAAGGWPYPASELEHAVARGFAALNR